uniref:Uncharacterized protein n=1 Tax=Meloidogyne enterolobii TaxID=390850 RepID=A0A6V7YD52_MELEN|nr:unnamed protein product [Meloidogyne enterolobii]
MDSSANQSGPSQTSSINKNVIEKKCSHCGRFGHWRMHCKFLNDKQYQPKRQWSDNNNHSGSPHCAILDIFDPMQSVEKEEWIKQKVKFGELDIEMIVDTASQINVVNKEVWKSIGQPKIEKVNYSEIRRDEWSNKKKLLSEDIKRMNISEETIVSESSVTSSSVNSVDKSKKIKAKTQDTYNGNKPKMKDVEEDKQMET